MKLRSISLNKKHKKEIGKFLHIKNKKYELIIKFLWGRGNCPFPAFFRKDVKFTFTGKRAMNYKNILDKGKKAA